MTEKLPERDKYTCLLAARLIDGTLTVNLQKVRKNGRMMAHSMPLKIANAAISTTQAKAVLKYLGGTQIIHFSENLAIARLDETIKGQGFSPLDNAFHDAAPLIKALCRTPGLPDDPDLDDLAHLHGVIQDIRDDARSNVIARTILLHNAWRLAIQPALTYARDLSEHCVIAPRAIDEIDFSLHGLPLPAPLVPIVASPAAGWRRTKWTPQEARDCAFRFVEGATLEDLCRITRRSPRAIHARLHLDGILQSP